jgi:hypothetical protein
MLVLGFFFCLSSLNRQFFVTNFMNLTTLSCRCSDPELKGASTKSWVVCGKDA